MEGSPPVRRDAHNVHTQTHIQKYERGQKMRAPVECDPCKSEVGGPLEAAARRRLTWLRLSLSARAASVLYEMINLAGVR